MCRRPIEVESVTNQLIIQELYRVRKIDFPRAGRSHKAWPRRKGGISKKFLTV